MFEIKTFEEFKDEYYKTGRLLSDISIRKNKLNETQLKTKYEKYIKKIEKDYQKMEENKYNLDEEWIDLKSKLNLNKCQLIKRLEEEGMESLVSVLKENASWLVYTIDPAHIFPKGGYPFLKYEVENVVPLNRYSHSCIDFMRDPIDGTLITKEKQQLYWEFIAGTTTYNRLKKRIKENGSIG